MLYTVNSKTLVYANNDPINTDDVNVIRYIKSLKLYEFHKDQQKSNLSS